jgi:penicillin-binding protein 2A
MKMINKKKEKKEINEPQKDDELIKIKKELEKKDEEMNDIFDEMRAEEEVKKEFQKRKEKEKKKEEKEKDEKEKKEMREMNEIFFLTDGYFFDTKQACEIFNKHYLSHTTDKIKNRKQINKQKVFDYFITSIATGTLDEVQGKKVGLFMEDLNRYNIIYCSKKAASKKELNAQPHPKINPHNTKLVEEYQKIIKKNKNDYYSVFVSLAAHEISACHNISLEAVYPTFLIGLEIIKRKVECQKNNITSINEDQLYRVKINEKALQQELEKIASDTKEGGFILDCTNKSKSTLKDYVALYDYHLKGFFSSELIRNYLKTKNFINAEGYIMYDPVYRNVMGAECKNKKKYEGDELKAKIITGIKGIDVPARIKDKELEVKKAVEKQNDHIGKKIPFSKEINQYNQTKKKRKKKKEGSEEGNSSSGGSQSEGEGSSGDEQNEPKKEESPETPNQ